MTTETITDTTPRPLRAPPARPTKMQVCCGQCTCLQESVEVDEGVGWCAVFSQYRSLLIDRDCSEFRTRTTED